MDFGDEVVFQHLKMSTILIESVILLTLKEVLSILLSMKNLILMKVAVKFQEK
jgi:hypothetical protein